MLYFINTQIHRRPFLNPVTESMACSQFEYINRTIHFVMALHDFVLRINAILVTSIYLCLQFSKVTLRDSFLRQVPTIPVACRLTNLQARNYLTSEGSVKPPNTNAGYFCLRVYFYFYTYLSLQICFLPSLLSLTLTAKRGRGGGAVLSNQSQRADQSQVSRRPRPKPHQSYTAGSVALCFEEKRNTPIACWT